MPALLAGLGFPAAADPPHFALSRDLFLRLLALVYLAAFASLTPQILPLVGGDGLLPAAGYLERVREVSGPAAYHQLPTLLWLWPSDALLLGLCWLGMALSAAALAGVAPRAVFPALWACYLSLVVAGQEFLQFQWDALLLEAGLLAVLYAPAGRRVRLGAGSEPGAAARWLVWFLAFKLTFLSGVTKLLSGDATWRGLTALQHHFETQPLPTRLSWYAHNAPDWFGALSVCVMFFIEVAVSFTILAPPRLRRVRMTGCALLCLLQALIAATGNYGFFNLLAVVLYLSLLDDDAVAALLRLGISPAGMRQGVGGPARAWRQSARAAVAGVLLGLSALTLAGELRRSAPMPAWADAALGWAGPFQSVNGYGLFRVMTTRRFEIVVEGSADGLTWLEYPFRWKPGDPARAPGFMQPHMPRLDWQMWFAALDPRGNAHWLLPLAEGLLAGDRAALGLVDRAPFPDGPPRFVRLMLYRYRFTTRTEAAGGAWWARERLGPLAEPIGGQP